MTFLGHWIKLTDFVDQKGVDFCALTSVDPGERRLVLSATSQVVP